jgi:O-antigen/teichoic acid export membrane protein
MVSEANRLKDTSTLEVLYKKSSINQSVIAGILFLGLWFNVDSIFGLIPHGDVYIQGKWVVFFIGLAKVFDMVMGINAEIIGTSRYYRMDLLLLVLLGGIGIAANFVFIPIFGMTGAAMASALSVILFNLMRFIFIFVKFRIHPFSLGTIKILCIAAAVVVLNGVLPSLPSTLADIAFRSIVLGTVFIGLSIAAQVSDDINTIVVKVARRFGLMA